VNTTYIAPLGAPTWIDLGTSDLQRAQEFYGAVFGWTFEAGGEEYGGYVMALIDGRPVAGLMTNDPQWNMPDSWTTYLHTADADATIEAVVAAGGTSCGGVMDVPAKGRTAIVTDRAGGVVGLWQPAEHTGFEVVGAAGTPVWHQLTTRDFDQAIDFYRTVFGWEMRVEADAPEFRYSNAIFAGEPLLGVMDGQNVLAEGVPSTWTAFLGAEDVDKTVEVVIANGGSVIRAAEDTPYGRLAAVADTTGAAFNLSSLEH
jgi:predicted enzyme related to lactoylglutathione lyase